MESPGISEFPKSVFLCTNKRFAIHTRFTSSFVARHRQASKRQSQPYNRFVGQYGTLCSLHFRYICINTVQPIQTHWMNSHGFKITVYQ